MRRMPACRRIGMRRRQAYTGSFMSRHAPR